MRCFNDESELRMAMRHAREGCACVIKQCKLQAKLRQRGLSTREAEDVVTWMVEAQWALKGDYEKVRQQTLAHLEAAMAAASPPVNPASGAFHRQSR